MLHRESTAEPDSADVFQIEKFDRHEGWTLFYSDERFRQRYMIKGKRIYTETVTVIDAKVDSIRDRLRGNWDWWENGRYENRTVLPMGKIRYDLWPGGRLMHVQEIMYAPVEIAGGGWRIRIEMANHMKGVAYFDIRPHRDLGAEVLGRFAGAEVAGITRLLGPKRAAIKHLLAERGALGFPFRKGTGMPGLIKQLERAA